MNNLPILTQLETLLLQIKKDRKNLLDLFEIAFGDDPRFDPIRSRILLLFGRDGLEGRIKRIILEAGGNHEN